MHNRAFALLAGIVGFAAFGGAANGQTTYNVSEVTGLRSAVAAVNNGPGDGDTIVLAPGIYRLTSQVDILQPVTIVGDPESSSIIDGTLLDSASGTLIRVRSLASLTLQNLTLQNATTAIDALESRGAVTAVGVTITGMSNTGIAMSDSQGLTILQNSTIAHNHSQSDFQLSRGLAAQCSFVVQLLNVTITDNDQGISFEAPCGSIEITNSIVAGNARGGDCAGSGRFTSLGSGSIESDGSCDRFDYEMTTVPASQLRLGPLALNGGPTRTVALQATSPAIDAGDDTRCPAEDQRGFSRGDGQCDVGAYEFGAGATGNTPIGTNVSVSPAPNLTVTFSQVGTAGNTTATTTSGPPAPAGFAVDGLVYDISTTASVTGPVTVCLPYSPADPSPRLLHFESGVWMDRTMSIDSASHLICGQAPSLSPFAVMFDAAPPSVQVPADIAVDATSCSNGLCGAVVAYTVTATDNFDPNPAVSCDPPSGSLFPVNAPEAWTIVVCSATDASGNTSPPTTFRVHVRGAGEQIVNLEALVRNFGLDASMQRQLVGALDSAAAALGTGDSPAACRSLDKFMNLAAAYTLPPSANAPAQSKRTFLTAQQQAQLNDGAQRIEGLIGVCH